MRTDDLIACLAADAPPSPPRRLEGRLAAVLAPSALAVLAGVLLVLGVRPDLAVAVTGGVFWLKALYTAALAVGGFWLLSRAGRPGRRTGAPLLMLALLLTAAVGWGLGQVLLTEPALRAPLLQGGSARVCSINIAGLSVLAAPVIVWAARRYAPVRPALAGAALGLLVGGLAATVYGLHCAERAPAFVALWYTLGVAAPTLAGALTGRLVWRW